MFKKILAGILTLSLLIPSALGETVHIDNLKGLNRSVKADRIQDGEHDIFQNVYIRYGNINNIKGRNRLNSTAHSDTVVNGLFYYENQAGTTKKIIVAESDELVTYDIDGTNRTQIANTLTNETWDGVQIGDTFYLTSTTNGLYKWPGSGSATLITGVSAPSSVDFTTSTAVGGLTPGENALISPKYGPNTISGTDSVRHPTGSSTCTAGPVTTFRVCDSTTKIGINVTAESGCGAGCASGVSTTNFCPYSWFKVYATTSTYRYKVTKYNSVTGIESEASSEDTASLAGSNVFDASPAGAYSQYSGSTTCASGESAVYTDSTVYATGIPSTSTTSTLASAPTSPFNKYRIYRSVAGGSDFFLLGEGDGGATYTDGKPDVALSTPLDTTIDTVNPPTFKYIEEYKGTIFVAEGDTIKYSHLPVNLDTDIDKYWLDTDELQVTGNITGLIKASDSLLIFTTKSIYQLVGFGVTSFQLVPIVNGTGAVSNNTIRVDSNGDVIFFSGTDGLYKLQVGEQQTTSTTGSIVARNNAKLIKLSTPNMDEVFRGDDAVIDLNPTDYTSSHAYYDSDNDHYHLFINDQELMYDALNQVWSYIPASKMSASLFRKSPNAKGVGVMVDSVGFFYNNWTGNEMGIESGTVTGNPTSSTNNTLTCSTCTFNTTNDGLKGLWVYLDNDNDEYRQITSNTSTTITVSSNWTTNPISADSFYIAHIIPKFRTKQFSFAKAPDQSKISLFYLNHNKSASTQNAEIYSYQGKSSIATNAFTFDLSTNFINSFNTRMRSSWVQWEFKTWVYNTSDTVDTPVDIIFYAVDVQAEKDIS